MDVGGTLYSSLVGQLAHHHNDVALAAQKLANFFGFQGAGVNFVRANERNLGRQSLVGWHTVDIHQRHACGCCQSCHLRGCRCVNRVHHNRVHFGSDEVLNLAQLLAHVVVGVFNLKINLLVFCIGNHAVAQNGKEVVVKFCHRYADLLSHCSAGKHGGRSQCDNNAFHHGSSPPVVPGLHLGFRRL